jgi:hypothetical protein
MSEWITGLSLIMVGTVTVRKSMALGLKKKKNSILKLPTKE